MNKFNYVFKDRDFILTKDNFFFCIIGYDHPRDRAIAYLKYAPAEKGKWNLKNIPLKRMIPHYSATSVENTYKFLEKYPVYIYNDELNNIKITAVPKSLIKNYYETRKKLQNILNKDNIDNLQQKLIELAQFLSDHSGIALENMGVTGSILIDIHNPSFSDIDMTIHGLKNSKKIEKLLIEEFSRKGRIAKFKNNKELMEWVSRKSSQFKFEKKIAEKLVSRQWNFGYFDDTRFSIHPIKQDKKIINNYGNERITPLGLLKIRGVILNSDESYFLPAIYELTDVEILEGNNVEEIKLIISYEGLYRNIAHKDEIIEAFGKLEKVYEFNSSKSYYRLLIGSFEAQSMDYIIPIS